jgi:peptide/nickel transport system substrate-binding protein
MTQALKKGFSRRTLLKGAAAAALAGGTVVSGRRCRDAWAQGTRTDATLTWGEDQDYATLDPRVTQSRHEAQAIMQMFESLLFLDTDGKFSPWLAERWEYSKDGKSITFHLRGDVKFHDGTPFNAEAVKFTFDTIVDPKLGSQGAIDFLGPYKSTQVLDPYTVAVTWDEPFAAALTNLSNPWLLSFVSPAAVKKLGNDGFARNPVGTGPFKFVEWVPRVRVVLERNEDYRWAPKVFKHQGPANVKRVVIRIIPDGSTRVAALEKNEIDICDQVPPIEVKRFQGTPNFDTVVGDVSGIPLSHLINTQAQPTNDLRVRQAYMHAVNRPQVVQQVFFGVAKPAYGPITPTTPGYSPAVETMFPYDPAKARQLLDEAGWKMGAGGIREKNGRPLEIHFITLLEPDLEVAVQAAVRDVGIKLNVETVTKARQDEMVMHGQYNIGEIRWVAVDPSVLDIPFSSRNIPAPGKFKFNWSRFGSPELDRMLRQADGQIDVAQRKRTLAEVQAFVLNRGLMFPVHISPQPIAYRRAIKNLKFAQGYWQMYFYDAAVG